MHMDKQKAARAAKKYEAAAKNTRSKKDKEKLLGRADVFRFIQASLGEKPPSMKSMRRAVKKAARRDAH
jgi:hypothetical protein